MVTNVTSLTGNGLKDWLIQRVTAIYFAVYVFYLMGYLLWHPNLSYSTWQNLFACPYWQVASVIALLALSLHAWIGIWTVTTDYLRNTALRVSIQMLVALGLLSQFFWGFKMLWGH
jgi:succinate dehydrogenase / fumarate reductase membrane anchor subunit